MFKEKSCGAIGLLFYDSAFPRLANRFIFLRQHKKEAQSSFLLL